MNSNISNWLSNVKPDDIDGGLAADFDGSLSGLGVEMGANTYNMSEALLALPSVYKQENNRSTNNFMLQHDESEGSLIGVYSISNESPTTSRSLTLPLLRTVSFPSVELGVSSSHSASLPSLTDAHNLTTGDVEGSLVDPDSINTEWVSLMTSMKLGEVEDYSCKPRFQYILNASTSPATKMCEETLTYLNQGQPYEVTLKHLKDGSHSELPLLKSIIRVVFHEKRLQTIEQQQMEGWRSMRPGERILDIDLPLSHGVMDVKVDPLELSSVQFVWDPNSLDTTSVFIKVNCVSSEFTAKKHGGEKGVPFRLRVETYSNSLDDDYVLLHYASCQIKVFKPKGADRKNKTDKEKIEKQGESEKGKFQPAFNCTVLTETKEQSLTNHSIPSGTLPCLTQPALPPCTTSIPLTVTSLAISSTSSCCSSNQTCQSIAATGQVVHPSIFGLCHVNSCEAPSKKQNKLLVVSTNQVPVMPSSSGTVSRKRPLETSSYVCSPHSSPTFNEDTILPSSTPEEVSRWLISNRFHDFVESFSNFSGSDLLRLRREDLIQICGVPNGIRLHYTLLAKASDYLSSEVLNFKRTRRFPNCIHDDLCVQPRLILYVCQESNLPTNDKAQPPVQPPGQPPCDSQLSPESSKSRSTTSSPIPAAPQNQESHPSPDRVGALGSISSDIKASSPSKDSLLMSSEEKISKPQFQFPSFVFSASSSCSNAPSKTGSCKARNRQQHFSPENRRKFDFNFATNGRDQTTKFAAEPSETCVDVSGEVSALCNPPAPSSFSSAGFPPIYSNKRSMSDKDEDSCNQSLLVFKKQRIQNPEVVQREVFHAVFLETLTERHLASKLAGFFSLQPDMIAHVLLKNSLGFFVLVDDEVVQNMRDSSNFVIDAVEDEDFVGMYKIILKPIEN